MLTETDSKYAGSDNYGQPKGTYLEKLSAMSDEDLERETYQMIYQAARCANNPRADWHWKTDACYDEAKKRDNGKATVYRRAYDRCYADHAS